MDKVIGFFPMVGDLLHPGHLLAIEEAKSHCDYLIVGLNCSPMNKSPIESIYERFMRLRAVRFVDEIIPYNGKKDLELLADTFNYQIRFLGADYKNKDWDGKHNEEKRNIIPFFLTRVHDLSSTSLKERIVEHEGKEILS